MDRRVHGKETKELKLAAARLRKLKALLRSRRGLAYHDGTCAQNSPQQWTQSKIVWKKERKKKEKKYDAQIKMAHKITQSNKNTKQDYSKRKSQHADNVIEPCFGNALFLGERLFKRTSQMSNVMVHALRWCDSIMRGNCEENARSENTRAVANGSSRCGAVTLNSN